MTELPIDAGQISDFRRLSGILMQRIGWQIVAVPGLVPDEVFFEHLAHRRFPADNLGQALAAAFAQQGARLVRLGRETEVMRTVLGKEGPEHRYWATGWLDTRQVSAAHQLQLCASDDDGYTRESCRHAGH